MHYYQGSLDMQVDFTLENFIHMLGKRISASFLYDQINMYLHVSVQGIPVHET